MKRIEGFFRSELGIRKSGISESGNSHQLKVPRPFPRPFPLLGMLREGKARMGAVLQGAKT